MKTTPDTKPDNNAAIPPIPKPPLKDLTVLPVRFCLNCDDMDDLAVSPDVDELDAVKDRFRNCHDTGRFQGDVCSRLYVASDAGDAELFEDDIED